MGHNKYDIGDVIRLAAEFKDLDDQLVDPTEVLLTVTSPAGVDYVYTYGQAEVVKVSTGLYQYDFDTSVLTNDLDSGTWHYRFYASGAAQGAEERAFIIRYSPVLA